MAPTTATSCLRCSQYHSLQQQAARLFRMHERLTGSGKMCTATCIKLCIDTITSRIAGNACATSAANACIRNIWFALTTLGGCMLWGRLQSDLLGHSTKQVSTKTKSKGIPGKGWPPPAGWSHNRPRQRSRGQSGTGVAGPQHCGAGPFAAGCTLTQPGLVPQSTTPAPSV